MRRPAKNWLEWTVFGAGLALVSGLIVYLAVAAATMSSDPPRLTVRVGTAEETPGGFALPIAVINDGDTTAESVLIEVKHGEGDSAERSELTLAFVPHGATRRGWVTFTGSPNPSQVRVRVLGYEEP